MRIVLVLFTSAPLLIGCGTLPVFKGVPAEAEARNAGVSLDLSGVRPRARPDGLPVSVVAPGMPDAPMTAAEFDTVSDAEKAAATAPAPSGGALGTTVASLGNPAETGLWIKTPLVRKEGAGRVAYGPTGKSVAVTLMPIDGPATAGSRLSLSAFQTLGAPLTELVELTVSTN